jgi:hypothetical protein
MKNRSLVHVLSVAAVTLWVTSAYASTVDNPGSIGFAANSDSHIWSGTGLNMYTQNASIAGTIDSSGVSTFLLGDVSFNAYTDANNYTTLLQITADGSGTYCPNSGDATITLTGRIKVTKVANVSIAATPCYISINAGSSFTLTTKTSGSITGTDFKHANPKLVVTMSLGSTVTGTCTSAQKDSIHNYWGLGTTAGTTTFQLFDATISPTNFTGTGC